MCNLIEHSLLRLSCYTAWLVISIFIMPSMLLCGRFSLVAFFSFLRKSNLVSDSQALSLKLLRRRDLTFTDHGAMFLPPKPSSLLSARSVSLYHLFPVQCFALWRHCILICGSILHPPAPRFFRFTLSALLVFEPSLTLNSLPFLLGLYRPLGPIPHAFLLIVLGEGALTSHLNVVYPPS